MQIGVVTNPGKPVPAGKSTFATARQTEVAPFTQEPSHTYQYYGSDERFFVPKPPHSKGASC